MKKRRPFLIIALIVVLVVVGVVLHVRQQRLVLTGIVTTDEVIVSPEIQGQVQRLAVQQGDIVKRGQLIAEISPAEWKADQAYYDSVEKSAADAVGQAKAELDYQRTLTDQQVKQAQANVAAAEANVKQADADLDNAKLSFGRAQTLRQRGANSAQDLDQARTTYDAAVARGAAMRSAVRAAQAALDVAQAGAAQVAVREASLAASRRQLAAADAQKRKAEIRVGYTKLKAPVDGIVDVRAALPGEVVNPGQAVVTLIDPDNLWVRADVEETYIDRIHLGDRLTVRLPSGAEREGTVFFRGVDADYATQRDVSRTKRDIKTFEIRLRCDNRDRSLAVGMTAYVVLPFSS
ncbi:MAG TPA: efflux RND transporter periplasmic adaptor subunit [Opitutaceae bacterium]|nr:efflux RND transporter periplasmic adaptor subunit [Opitutaceae bacterium]